MIKYIVIDSGSDASKLMFLDLKKMNGVLETSKPFDINNPLLRIANRIHMSGLIKNYINLPCKSIWNKYSVCEIAKKDLNNKYVIVFTNISVKKYTIEYLENIRSLTSVKMVLVLVDSCVDQKLYPEEYIKRIHFDIIYSFDEMDCINFGFIKTRSLYSKRTDIIPSKNECDLFFIGRAKDRLKMLMTIAEEGNKNGIICNFFVLGVPHKDRKAINGVHYLDEVMPYDKVLQLILASKCLLDVVQNGQSGLTMRVYEAVFYNKRLITNNSYIKSFPYYQEKYMSIFTNINDIDFSKVKDRSTINYYYNGEFSPIRLIEDIGNRLIQNEKGGDINDN